MWPHSEADVPTWIKALVGVLAIAAAGVVVASASAALRRRHLRQLLTGRDAAVALATCVEAFPDVERERVVLAYLWVQQLVDLEGAPIRADDDLRRDLHIDQGEADAKFESSHEWRAEEVQSPVTPPEGSVRSVRDLVGQVLAYGYEGYSRVARPEQHARRDSLPDL
jgi:hypothetical protein